MGCSSGRATGRTCECHASDARRPQQALETHSHVRGGRPSLDPVNDTNDAVVGRFVKDGRLVIMPSKRSKLLLVLDHLAQEFEPGRTYAEREVNDVLGGYHDDFAA